VRGVAFLSAASDAAGNAIATTDARAAAEAPLTIERRVTGVALIVVKACTAALSKQAHARVRKCMMNKRLCSCSAEAASDQPASINGRQRSSPLGAQGLLLNFA
jgi:hypothetical protein